MSSPSQGSRIEDYARRLAGGLGVPDFVYEPVLIRRGNSSREVSDGLLVAGPDGVIMQVKSRESEAAQDDSIEKAINWSLKNGLAGHRQGTGTRRTLVANTVRMRSLRGYERDLPDASSWPVVVIIDHPLGPSAAFEPSPDTLFISSADWLNLHNMVRSTAGVISYVRRALSSGISVPLGKEARRYGALAEADLQAASGLTSFPTLPYGPLSNQELQDVALFDDLVERVADPIGSTGWDPEEYLTIVEQLDRAPLIARSRIGAKMREKFVEMATTKAIRTFRAFDPSGGKDRLAFLYAYDDGRYGEDGQQFIAEVACYTALRQHQALDAGAGTSFATLGIGILHSTDRGQRFSFARFPGRPTAFPDDLLRSLEARYGNPHL
ncbi:hypothetical protein ACFXCZ_24375 [Streptomyces sp. NPDC059396]|uniref:hypothetical protein n=1 Tax=Streptomyces sp. NPDC059396 TaxID=3346819 RepID=UPI00368651AA